MSRRPSEGLRQIDIRAAMDFQSRDPQGVDHQPRRNVQHERLEQRALFAWVQKHSWSGCWAHWPNERQSRSEAHQLKAQGVRRGMPDNWLFLPVGGRPGAVSELKRVGATRSAVKADQRSWLLMLEDQGWAVGAHRGWVEASEFFRDYLAGEWVSDAGAWWR